MAEAVDGRRILNEMLARGTTVKELKDRAYALDHRHQVAAADLINDEADKIKADMLSKGLDPAVMHVRRG